MKMNSTLQKETLVKYGSNFFDFFNSCRGMHLMNMNVYKQPLKPARLTKTKTSMVHRPARSAGTELGPSARLELVIK